MREVFEDVILKTSSNFNLQMNLVALGIKEIVPD